MILPQRQGYETVGKYYYKGSNCSQPQVGDIRISYKYVPSGIKVSIIGKQNSDNTISAMPVKDNQLYLQYSGTFSLDEMLKKFKQSNVLLTFGLRLGGFILMCLGLYLLIRPIIFITRFIPFLSSIVEYFSFFMVVIVSCILSLLTIAIAWFAYMPLLAVALLIAIGVVIYFAMQYLKNKNNN